MRNIAQVRILVLSFVVTLMFKVGPVSGEESVTVPACGLTPGVTQSSYSGMVEITVSGAVVNVPPANGSDGFYGIVDGVLVGPAPGEFRLARVSASANTCEVQSTVHFPVSDFLVDPYPQPDPSHIYTVLLDIGDPLDRLIFGIRDCGCADNSGSLAVRIRQITPFANLTAKLDIAATPPSAFAVNATFTLGAGSDGLNPAGEDVALVIGTFSAAIPAGSFIFHPAKRNSLANFTFLGEIDNALLDVKITDLGNGRFQLQAKGQDADLAGVTNPVTVGLTIGNDEGSTTVKAKFH